MRKYINLKVVFLIVISVMLIINTYFILCINQETNKISVRMLMNSGENFTTADMEKIQNDDKVKIYQLSGFKEKGENEVKEPLTGRSVTLTDAVVWGDASLVYESLLLSGTYEFWSSDQCILSSKAADEIFRSSNVIGAELILEGRNLTVSGIFYYPKPVILTQAEKDDTFNALEAVYPNGIESGTEIKSLFNRNLIMKNIVCIEYSIYTGICRVFYVLVFLFLLYIISRKLGKYTDNKVLNYLRIFIFASVVVYLAGQMFRFPISFIPVKWSNFDFWINIGKEVISNYNYVRRAVPVDKDITFFMNVEFSILTSLLIIIMLIVNYMLLTSWSKTSHNRKEYKTLGNMKNKGEI